MLRTPMTQNAVIPAATVTGTQPPKQRGGPKTLVILFSALASPFLIAYAWQSYKHRR